MTWEYLTTAADNDLTQLGRQGWELVGVLPAAGEPGARYYFKRPGTDFRDRVTLDQKRHYYARLGIASADAGSPSG